MFSVKTCLRKKVSHLAETAGNSTLLAWRKREREREMEGTVGRAESAEVVFRTAESAGKRLNLLKMCAQREID